MPIISKVSFDQKISAHLAFIFLLVLSFFVAWFTLNKAEDIVENAAASKTFDMKKRTEINVKK